MEKFLRSWRQDALNRGQNDSAVYIGDKVLALTNSDADAFWLAQVHFNNNNFTRALALLSRKDLISRSTSCKYLAAHCYIKQNKFEAALNVLGDQNPTHLINAAGHSRRKIQHLNGHSHVTLRNGKTAASRSDRADRNEEREREDANNLRFEAAMCYLRGLCYAKQNAFDRARDCYKDAVRIDIQCFEAFDQLMKNSLMSPAEELEFLESLDFDSVTIPSDPSKSQEAAHFVKMLYTTRLSKYTAPATLADATETLSTHYNLANNPDILLSRAEALYTQCRFAEALELSSSILTSPETGGALIESSVIPGQNLGHSPAVYPLHLACLYETGAVNALFLLSHTLADNAPEEPYTYLAIGVYYLSVAKIAEARRFFSKASLLDPHSAPAWIGFAHTFAAEGEHDQAIAAYSTAARLFQGSHLPQLFLGMQHLALNNMSLAHEYLCAAYAMSSGSPSGSLTTIPSVPSGGLPALGGDPLVLNELGVVLYHQANLEPAADLFRQALLLADSLQCDPGAWVATRANLGHALRRMGHLDEALAQFDECIRVGAGGGATGYSAAIGGVTATSAGVAGYEDRGLIGSLHTSRGLIYLQQGRTLEAVTVLHEAVRVLGVSGGDAAGGAGIAGTILSRALELWSIEGRTKVIGPGTGRQKRDTLPRSRDDPFGSSMTDPIVHGGNTIEDDVEMELDEHAKDLLGAALNKVRPRRTGKRPQRPAASIDLPPQDMEIEEPIGRSNRGESQLPSRRSPTRRVQSRRPDGA
ncbi:20S cyclosome subunit (Cut9/Cdc16), putative [Talaromyces stipitatus ATCC 10500]|uniref:20S cyclosome subunit (Cut9/Cdc16), putative n=1 Tax=Talaromyces stipitatus (strain ATCC 10500 / CBS 375.48 / QM 6759 / NRRL 1006) TaxID=441959 RepID=B8MAR6_TALSN|nr:20S cyclosome subunit (Cut9/Cdc16), putative [Talaromyces stipitatus ATCC 10500]EED17756.1 20S cyclosome subunit (Cut9/Cdc16), putative [Talaromyces stipitatus ATCC 10500]